MSDGGAPEDVLEDSDVDDAAYEAISLDSPNGFGMNSWSGAWGSDGPIRTGDLNGDGKADVFMWRDSDKSWTVNLSYGSGFTMQRWTGAWGSDGPIRVGDLNADGKTDVFMWRGSDKSWTVNLSSGSGFTMQRWTGAWGSDGTIQVGDLNGDKKTDVFMFRAAKGDWTVNLSTGTGFTARRWLGACGTDGPSLLGDFNADGKADVAIWRDANKDWLVNFSLGYGFHVQRWEGMWGSDGPMFAADLNGDRRTDVFMWRDPKKLWSVNLSYPTTLGGYRWFDHGISAVEVNQATQDLKNGMPLFAGKRTLVRVYADAGMCSSGPPRDNVALSATVFRAANLSTPVWGPVTIGPESVPHQVSRDNLADTINFELPASGPASGPWSTTEAYVLRVVANPCINLADLSASCARRLPGRGQTVNTPLRFYASVPLHVRPFYDNANGMQVTQAQFAQVVRRVEAMYPTAKIVIHDFNDVIPSITWGKLGSAREDAIAADNIDLLKGRTPTHCSDCFFVGVPWVSPGSVPWGVASSTPAATPEYRLVVAAVDPTDINWSAGTLAQEVGHILGRWHAGGSHGEDSADTNYPYADGALSDDATYTLLPNVISKGKHYGVDPGTLPTQPAYDWKVIPAYDAVQGWHRHDFMSYGAWVDIWTSDYTFKALCGANRSGYFDTQYGKASQLPLGSLPPNTICPDMTPFVLP
jgi:hypothetical protein